MVMKCDNPGKEKAAERLEVVYRRIGELKLDPLLLSNYRKCRSLFNRGLPRVVRDIHYVGRTGEADDASAEVVLPRFDYQRCG